MSDPLTYLSNLAHRTNNFYEEWYNMEGIMMGLTYAGSFYMVLLLIELVFDLIKGKRKDIWEPIANGSFSVITAVAEASVYGLVLGAFFVFLSDFALSTMPINWVTWAVCLIATDFSYYWMHRCEHKVRFFWVMHSVHHSSEEYDLSTAMRLFWFLDFSLWLFFAPLIIIGFSNLQVLSCMVIVFTYMTWVHTDKIDKLGWFDKVFNSPSVHRVHHGANRQYIDKNYAGILVIWDRIFGSYEPEVEPVRYGLTKPINTSNPFKVGLYEFISLAHDLRHAHNWSDRLCYLFKGPGWRPKNKNAPNKVSSNHKSSVV